jgi:hypothetical protein
MSHRRDDYEKKELKHFRDGKDRNSWDTYFRVNKGNILHKKYINL